MSARRAAAAAALAVAVLAAGCGQASDRDRVAAYITKVDAVQQDRAPALARAETAVRAFAAGSPTGGGLPALEAAAPALRATRDRLAAVPAPQAAGVLRERLLRLYDLEAARAAETARLARYRPAASRALAVLPAAAARLRSGLATGGGIPGQTAALRRYGRTLATAATALRRLDPPPVVRASHTEIVRGLVRAGGLAGRVADAVQARDGATAARLLGQLTAGSGGGDAAAAAAVRAYRRRVVEVARARAAVETERRRLDASLR